MLLVPNQCSGDPPARGSLARRLLDARGPVVEHASPHAGAQDASDTNGLCQPVARVSHPFAGHLRGACVTGSVLHGVRHFTLGSSCRVTHPYVGNLRGAISCGKLLVGHA
eukprot:9479981-Pyramimonas_sp.AAC.1